MYVKNFENESYYNNSQFSVIEKDFFFNQASLKVFPKIRISLTFIIIANLEFFPRPTVPLFLNFGGKFR